MPERSLFERLVLYMRLARIDRPIGWLLLLWPTLWALWIAGDGSPDPYIATVFLVGVVVMRSAGCVINDYADRDFDLHVDRTRSRPLAAGEVTTGEAIAVFVVLSLLALALVLTLNRLTILLSIAGMAIAVSYPLFKRFTNLPQFYLGIAFSWGIPMAFAAHLDYVPMIAWVLLLANLLWTVAYDTLYAMADRPDDLRIGVKSTAILFGRFDRLLVACFHASAFLVLAWIGYTLNLNFYFYGALLLACILAAWEQVMSAQRDRQRCFEAFLHNNWIGAVIFAGIVLSYL